MTLSTAFCSSPFALVQGIWLAYRQKRQVYQATYQKYAAMAQDRLKGHRGVYAEFQAKGTHGWYAITSNKNSTTTRLYEFDEAALRGYADTLERLTGVRHFAYCDYAKPQRRSNEYVYSRRNPRLSTPLGWERHDYGVYASWRWHDYVVAFIRNQLRAVSLL